jgi:5'-3' exonuclease
MLLIDATGLIFRGFYTIKHLAAPDGTPVNAVFGLVRILLKVYREIQATDSAMVFDAGTDTFRKEMFEDYKSNRAAPPDELKPQFDLALKVARATGAPVFSMRGFEADDLIATLSRVACERGDCRVVVLTGDRDLLQLLSPAVEVLLMKGAGEYRSYSPESFREEFGFPVDRYVDYKALMGDPSDNIPGLPGVGPKTAAKLVATYGKLDQIIGNIDSVEPIKLRQLIRENRELLYKYRELCTVHPSVPMEYDFTGRTLPDFSADELNAVLINCGFTRICEDARKLGDIAQLQA